MLPSRKYLRGGRVPGDTPPKSYREQGNFARKDGVKRAIRSEATMSSTMFSSANVAGYAAALREFPSRHVQNIARPSMVQGIE